MLKEALDVYQMRCDKFLSRIFDDRFDRTCVMQAEYAVFSGQKAFSEHTSLEYKSLHEGEVWGHDWDSAFVHIQCDIPAEWSGAPLAISLIFSGETLLFDQQGVPFYALTGNCVFQSAYFKDFLLVDQRTMKDGRIDFWCETAANGFGGKVPKRDPHHRDQQRETHCDARLISMKLGIFNREAWALYRDFEILHNLYGALPPAGYRAKKILTCLNEAISVYGYNSANAARARAILSRELSRPATSSALTTAAVGHAHIDVGWYWPVRESIRKAARTFASQLELLRRYPDYIFGASQPRLYAWVKEKYPELFAKIREAVAAGRWELQGGMWVEADCNVTSGESLIRQFVHGKNFFMDEFGIEVKNLWLPDVFGYSANLPQIISKSGCDYFLTQKLSWNQFNKLQYHTFVWSGIDGSSVLTHFLPENNYNAPMMPAELIAAQDRFTEGDFIDEFMTLTGIGDGGGGPSDLYLERAARMKDLEGVPKVIFSKAEDFFRRMEQYRGRLQKYHGELYLELHRGTLTTQARSKRFNRRIEQLLTAAEMIFACGNIDRYPSEEFDRIWKMLLTNQFHDILPGSAIREVYEVAEAEYQEAVDSLEALTADGIKALGTPQEGSTVIFNSLPWQFTGIIELSEKWIGHQVLDDEDNALPSQVENGRLMVKVTVPALSFTTLRRGEKSAVIPEKTSIERILENELIRYVFDDAGHLISAYDKITERELMVPGNVGNDLRMYVDRPNYWDAWDVEVFYRDEEQTTPHGVTVSEVRSGECASVMEIEFSIGRSKLRQQVVLTAYSRRLDFITHADWHEEHQLLRVSFPADIHTFEAAYDIQYGFLKRPLHENTPWEHAKFEVVCHRYLDLSEDDYGAALLNDSKYGCRAWDKTLDLALLRSPVYPDHLADQGEHFFTYSYLPHTGNLENSDVMQEAACLNRPLQIVEDYALHDFSLPVTADSVSVKVEVLKKAEKSNNLVIRLVECKGKSAKAVLRFAIPVQRLIETNLIEWSSSRIWDAPADTISLDFKPFEIKTFIIEKQ